MGTSPRIELRPLVEGHRAEFVRVLGVSAALHRPWLPTQAAGDTFDALFDRQLARVADGSALKLVGVLPDGRIGGFFNLNEVVRGCFGNAYAGWSVNVEVAGQGVATEGVRLLLDYAFAPAPGGGAGLHRVQANIIPRNVRSRRVAEKCGFRLEGIALRYLAIGGVWEDHAMYARTVEEHRPG